MSTKGDLVCRSFGYEPGSLECQAILSKGKLTKEQQRAFVGEAAGAGAAAVCTAYGGAAVAPICKKIGEWAGELVFDALSSVWTSDSDKKRKEERAAWSTWNQAKAVYDQQFAAIRLAAIEVIKLTLAELCTRGEARQFGLYLPADESRGLGVRGLLFTPPDCTINEHDAWELVSGAGGEPFSDWLDTMAFAFMAGTRTDQSAAAAEAKVNLDRLEPWAKLVQLSTIRAASNLAAAYAVEMDNPPVGWPTQRTATVTIFPLMTAATRAPGRLSAAQLAALKSVPKERRSWGAAAGIMFGVGLALGGVGLGMRAVA